MNSQRSSLVEPSAPALLQPADRPKSSQSSSSCLDAESESDWLAPTASFGPNHYLRTRELWLRGDLKNDSNRSSSRGRASSRRVDSGDALRRLDEVLEAPGVEDDLNIWSRYLSEVHSKLVGGTKVKKGFRLNQAVSSCPHSRLSVPSRHVHAHGMISSRRY